MKFAHIADAHLGAFSKNPKLRDLNLRAFEIAMEKCVEEDVDFILLAGDLFHNPIPDMDIVKRSVEIMRRAVDSGIRIYAVYGSHDFSPGTASLLDVLSSTGLFRKVVRMERNGDKIILRELRDESGVSIVGMSGLPSSAEVKYFEHVDREYLKGIPSPKIFMFHTTIAELKPAYISDKSAVPKSLLPGGFDYYAGGHLHERILSEKDGAPLVYPGALFGATYNDLDVLEKRGFYIVEDFKPRFVEIKVCEFFKKTVNADGLSATELYQELMSLAQQNYEGKVVILKVKGELRSGAIGDINFHEIREEFKKSALDLLLNTYALTTRERRAAHPVGGTKEEIEEKVFRELSPYGLRFTQELFHILRERAPEDMTKDAFEDRLWKRVYPLIIAAIEGKFLNKEHEEEEALDKAVAEEQKKERMSEEGEVEVELRETDAQRKEKMKSEKKRKEKMPTLFDFGGGGR